MKYCPNCGKEVSEYASFCPSCGTKLLESEARPATIIKRHLSITVCAILLFICSLIHIINMIDFMPIPEYGFMWIGQLFFSVFALIAGCFIWRAKEIGGIVGVAYAILTTIFTLLLPLQEVVEYTTYGIIIDVFLNIAIIILIVVGWKHLKHS